MKRELRYIRYRICRNIYYADQCPMDNRKNYKNIIKNFLMGFAFSIVYLSFGIVFILLA